MNCEEKLLADRYNDDETVGLGLAGSDPEGWVQVPERLFGRLVHLGRAYELHLLPVLEAYRDTKLVSKQCVILAEELRFVRSVVNDPALHSVVDSLLPVVDLIAKGPWQELVVSGP